MIINLVNDFGRSREYTAICDEHLDSRVYFMVSLFALETCNRPNDFLEECAHEAILRNCPGCIDKQHRSRNEQI